MSVQIFLALMTFAFVTSITPGPNNLMLLASGVNFGFKLTIPHMLGIGIGFTIMTALVGLGLGQIFVLYPSVYTTLKFLGATYMLWLAWKIARSGPVKQGSAASRPMRFIEAAAFQWVNPKAWVMAITAVTTYAIVGQPVFSAFVIAVVFGAVGLPTISTWALFGTVLRRFLSDPGYLKAFNWTMAGLLVASLWPLMMA